MSETSAARSRIEIAGFIAVWVLAFAPTWRQWSAVWWTSPQYDFGLVLASLTLWALLGARPGLAPNPSARWLVPLTGMSLAWLFAWLAGIAAVQQLAVVAWGWLAVHALYGRAQARRVTPAIAWLAFASEIWEHLSVPLQSLVVAVVPPVMKLLGLPSVVSGNHITIPAGMFIVEEGCSGVKYLISLLAFVCVLLYSMHFRRSSRVALVVLAACMALLANWFRVGVLIAVGQASQMQSPLLRDHSVFGWIVFAVALIPVVLVARRFAVTAPSMPVQPVAGSARPLWVSAAGAAAVAGPLVAGLIVLLAEGAAGSEPQPPAGWQAEGAPTLSIAVKGAPQVRVLRLSSGTGNVLTGSVHSPVPVRSDGLELLFGAMNPGSPRTYASLGRKGEIVTSRQRVIRFSERELLQTSGLRKVMRFWFDVGGRSYSGSAVAKASLALQAPLGTRFMTIHAVETECSQNCAAARTLLDQFMSAGS